MKTFSAKEQDIEKKWFLVDAENKVLGRLATAIAVRLRGKHKPLFTPHADTGDFVREFFGGCSYFAYAHINPDLPTEIVCHNVLWRIDWQNRTTSPISTIWRKTAPDRCPRMRRHEIMAAVGTARSDTG